MGRIWPPGRRLKIPALDHKEVFSPCLADAVLPTLVPPSLPRGEQGVSYAHDSAFHSLPPFPVFSLFSRETEKEKDTEEGEKETKEEDAIVYLLKTAKLNIMKGELDEAERILHEAARLSHKSENKNAIIYTYDMMANLAFVRGQMEQAEKLFKAAMSLMLAGDAKEDDNAIIEMSLKLTSIYAAQNQHELALAGYQFCILSLEDKMAKWKDLPAETLSEEEKENTSLLLGMSLDSYAQYLLANSQAAAAQKMYERALQIATEVQGERHPQTVVLMSDLATALDAQGRYDEAYVQVRKASELARQTQHPEVHIVLNNLAGILMHQEDFAQAKEVYQEALEQAEKNGDGASVRYIQKELAELGRRRRKRSQSQKIGAEPGKLGDTGKAADPGWEVLCAEDSAERTNESIAFLPFLAEETLRIDTEAKSFWETNLLMAVCRGAKFGFPQTALIEAGDPRGGGEARVSQWTNKVLLCWAM